MSRHPATIRVAARFVAATIVLGLAGCPAATPTRPAPQPTPDPAAGAIPPASRPASPPGAAPSAPSAAPTASGPTRPTVSAGPTPTRPSIGPGRGFPAAGPWLSYYGGADGLGDLAALAARYRVFDVDADPDTGNFTPAQIATLRAGGRNRVLSYLNLGSVETFRRYWASAPAGLVPARANRKARIGPYGGYADEYWMDPSDPDWRALLLAHVAPRLVAQGVDGFYFDNLELLSHGDATDEGPCGDACRQAGLDLVAALRAKYPDLLFVLQNGAGEATRLGRSGDGRFADLLDGVAHESVFTQPSDAEDAGDAVYRVATDEAVLADLRAWKALGLTPGGRPFWLAALEYVNRCDNVEDARTVRALGEAEGFAVYAADKSAGLTTLCDEGP